MPDDGDLVEVHFHGTLDDGSVFDSSRGRRARVFVIGRGQLLSAFEAALRPLRPGERTTLRLEPADGYGPVNPGAIYRVPLAEAPAGARPGDQVQLTDGRPATITGVEGDTVTVDANHPLAGRVLHFEIELVSCTPTTR